MKILVTGGEGNLGASIIAQGIGHKFISVGRNDWGKITAKVLSSVDAVVHCAYDLKNRITDSPDVIIESNILSTAKILKLIKKYKIPKLIFISSCAVYGSKSNTSEDSVIFPESFNGIVKYLNEKLIFDFCSDLDVDVKIFRIFNTYGGNDNFSVVYHLLNAARNGTEFTINNDGVAQRDFVHVKDVACIILKSLNIKIEWEIINIGTGNAVSVSELVKCVRDVKNIKLGSLQYPEIEYSRANISRLRSFSDHKFLNILIHLRYELTGL